MFFAGALYAFHKISHFAGGKLSNIKNNNNNSNNSSSISCIDPL